MDQKNDIKAKSLPAADGIRREVSSSYKTAQSLIRWATPYQMLSIIRVLQQKDGYIPELDLDSLLSNELDGDVSYQRVKDFLIKSHSLSIVFRDTADPERDLDIWYVSNLSSDKEINKKILVMMQNELLGIMPGYRNRTGHGINVYYLKRDCGAYLSRAKSYEVGKTQIRKGVIIASLHDALLDRQEDAAAFLKQFFIDEMRGKYGILSGDVSKKMDSIIRWTMEVVDNMKKVTARLETVDVKENVPMNDAARDWIEVYRRLSRNPATKAIRDTMSHAIEQFIVSSELIDEEKFQDYLKDLADIYMNTFDIEKLRDDDYKMRILKVIQFIWANNLEICTAIKGGIEGMPALDESLIDAFVYWVVEISLKIHQEFLNSLIKKYNVFYYLYIRSYFAHKGMKDSPSVISFITILRNLFYIKQSDSHLVRGVLARNPSILK